MINLPSLRQLRYLIAVIEKCHFGQAAEDCCVTQSTLSAGIKDLENLLGINLFERTKRRVVPTTSGIEIAAQARKILIQAEDLVDTAKAASEPLSGTLRIGIIPTISPYLVQRFLPTLQKIYPNLKPYLREDQTHNLLKQLTAGELDLLILAYPYKAPDTEFEQFMDDPLWVACPHNHALSKIKTPTIAIEDIHDDELLLLEDGHCLRDHILVACGIDDKNQQGFRGTSLGTLLQMVGVGVGITLIPEMAVKSRLFDGLNITMKPLSKDAITRKIGLTWRSASRRKPEFRMLASALRNIIAEP